MSKIFITINTNTSVNIAVNEEQLDSILRIAGVSQKEIAEIFQEEENRYSLRRKVANIIHPDPFTEIKYEK